MRRMVLRPRLVVPAVALAAATATGGFAQDVARGAAVLAEARKALGGEERFAAVRTMQARGDFRRIAGQNTIDGELELLIELPDKLRRNEDLSPPGGGPAIVRTEVLNGSDVWDENTGGGQFVFRRGGPGGGTGDRGAVRGGRAAIDPEQLRQLQVRTRQADLARVLLALLLTTSGTVAWVGTAESPDGKADVLEIKPIEGPLTRLFLDVNTHVPLMLTWQGVAPRMMIARRGGDPPPAAAPPRPQETTLRMTLGEYKTVNGLRLPHFITRGANDETTEEWTISSYRINPTFRADTFIKR
jgi:hypothetical protein